MIWGAVYVLLVSSAVHWEVVLRKGALVAVLAEPSEAMLIAARDWSVAKYGQGIGNAAAPPATAP